MTRLEADPDLDPGSRGQMLSAIRDALPALEDGTEHGAGGASEPHAADGADYPCLRRAQPGPLEQYPQLGSDRRSEGRCPGNAGRCPPSPVLPLGGAAGGDPGQYDPLWALPVHQLLQNQGFVKEPKQVYRKTCMLWNEASKTIPGWPQLEVQVPSEKLQYSFDWDQFPPSLLEDLEAYIQHLGNEDPFADDYLSPLRPATVANRRKQIRQIASAAVNAARKRSKTAASTASMEDVRSMRSPGLPIW